MEDILVNPGRAEDRFIITTLLLDENKWTKEAAEKWIQRRYRNYEYLGKTAGYHQFRVLPKSQIEEYEKKSAEIRGGKPGYRVFTFPTEKGIRALMLVLAPPLSKIESITQDIGDLGEGEEVEIEAGDILVNPVRKVTPEMEEEIKRLWREGYKVAEIRGIIRDKFGVSISASTIRRLTKDVERGKVLSSVSENIEGGETMGVGALPPELMSKAMSLYKEGKFKTKGEALKWAHAQKKSISAKPEEYQRVVSEVLINKGKKRSLKGGSTMARAKKVSAITDPGIKRTLARLTKAVEGLSNPAKKKRKRVKKPKAEGTIAKAVSDALRRVWAEDPTLSALRRYLSEKYGTEIPAVWTEHPEMREEIRSKMREAWLTKPGAAVRERLSEEVKAARRVEYPTEAMAMIGEPEPELGLDFIETAAMDVLFEDIGLPEWKPFTREMAIGPVLREAWRTKEGEAMKKAIREAWETQAGRAFRDILSSKIREARARVYKGEAAAALAELAEAIEAPEFKPFTARMGLGPRIRSAWAIPEAESLKAELAKAVRSAWGTETGITFRNELKKRLSKIWSAPTTVLRISPVTELAAIEQFPLDIARTFGFDLVIPGAVATVAEEWIHSFVKQLTSIPFGKKEDIEKQYWKKALVNILAGGIHYGAINYIINNYLRGDFFQKVRYMYSAYIVKDVIKALLPAQLFPGEAKPSRPISSTEEIESVEYGVLPIEDLRVSETGELEVPIEVYNKMKAASTEQGEEEEYEYLEETFGPVVKPEEIEPEVEIEQHESEPEVTIEEEGEEEGLASEI